MIENADTRFAGEMPSHRIAEFSLHPKFWPHRPNLRVPEATAVGVSVPVQVRHGRWLIQCPSCLSAQYASKVDRRFFCGECSNSDHGGMWVTVEWPDDVDNIEAVLDVRPIVNRNWLPGETVADLIAENDIHRILVDDKIRARHGGGSD